MCHYKKSITKRHYISYPHCNKYSGRNEIKYNTETISDIFVYICGVMEHRIEIKNTEELDRAAGEFLEQIGNHRLIAFYAPMGAGKTTFTSALCRRLGVDEPVCSPTFTIVNEYIASSGESIYHFDFYRITKNSEALDIGLYDYLDSGNLCLMEWPENVEDLLPDETLKVQIKVNPDLSRSIVWAD